MTQRPAPDSNKRVVIAHDDDGHVAWAKPTVRHVRTSHEAGCRVGSGRRLPRGGTPAPGDRATRPGSSATERGVVLIDTTYDEVRLRVEAGESDHRVEET